MGWVVKAKPQQLYPRVIDPVPTVQEAGWAPWPIWTGAERHAPHRDLIPEQSSPYQVATPIDLSWPTTLLYTSAKKLFKNYQILYFGPLNYARCSTVLVHCFLDSVMVTAAERIFSA